MNCQTLAQIKTISNLTTAIVYLLEAPITLLISFKEYRTTLHVLYWESGRVIMLLPSSLLFTGSQSPPVFNTKSVHSPSLPSLTLALSISQTFCSYTLLHANYALPTTLEFYPSLLSTLSLLVHADSLIKVLFSGIPSLSKLGTLTLICPFVPPLKLISSSLLI